MFRDKLAKMSNSEVLMFVPRETLKLVAVYAVSAIAFKVVVRIIAGPVEKDPTD